MLPCEVTSHSHGKHVEALSHEQVHQSQLSFPQAKETLFPWILPKTQPHRHTLLNHKNTRLLRVCFFTSQGKKVVTPKSQRNCALASPSPQTDSQVFLLSEQLLHNVVSVLPKFFFHFRKILQLMKQWAMWHTLAVQIMEKTPVGGSDSFLLNAVILSYINTAG